MLASWAVLEEQLGPGSPDVLHHDDTGRLHSVNGPRGERP
jgi:hypothetical protein